MEIKVLQQLERTMKTLGQDFRHLRVALNAHLAFASLNNPDAGAERGAWTKRELESALQQFEEDLQNFAQLIFTEKADGVSDAA